MSAVGVDVGLRWLVLAAARLRDRGVQAGLVCAGAGRLPFANDAVDVVASESLIENVMEAGPVLDEAIRVLRPGGKIWLTTANRWSLGPDPHVGMPLGGWWPERIVAAWATRRGMVPPRRRLVSAAELRDLLDGRQLRDVVIGPAPVADSQVADASWPVRGAVGGYRFASSTAIGRRLLTLIGPSLLAVASTPAADQRSRRSGA